MLDFENNVPSIIEINSLGIGLTNYSNIDRLDLNDNEFLVVGEQQSTTRETIDTKYSLVVNRDGVAINSTRRQISAIFDDSIKAPGLYVENDIMCAGNIIAKGIEIANINFDNVNSNLLRDVFNKVNSINPLFYRGYGGVKTINRNVIQLYNVNNIYSTSYITIGNITDTYQNTNPLNIVSTTDNNIKNIHISIKNNINNPFTAESAKLNIGIIGNSYISPAVVTTTTGMPLEFHIGRSTEQMNKLYRENTSFPNYNLNSNLLPAMVIDKDGSIGIGTVSIDNISYNKISQNIDKITSEKNVTEKPKLKLSGSALLENIITYDYYTNSNLHLDEIYARKLGINFGTENILPGEFLKGVFTFNSNVYIGHNTDSYTLEVNKHIDVKGDLTVANNANINKAYIQYGEFFEEAIFNQNVHMDRELIVDGSIEILNGFLSVEGNRVNVTDLRPILIDKNIIDASNIDNQSNILIFATNDVIQYTNKSNFIVPGKISIGLLNSDTDVSNDQLNVIKHNPKSIELALNDKSGIDTTNFPAAYIGHLNIFPDYAYSKDKSLVINTNEIPGQNYHNIYFYAGENLDRNRECTINPTLTVHQNASVGINISHPNPAFKLHVNADILCNDLYVNRNNIPSRGMFFILNKDYTAPYLDFSRDIYYLYDKNISRYCINFDIKPSDINLYGLNVKGGVHSFNDGYYEDNKKLATFKIIDNVNLKPAYVNNNIMLGWNGDTNMGMIPLSVRNIATNDYNNSILRFYRGTRFGGDLSLSDAKFSGIDICDFETPLGLDRNLYKWFIYKNHLTPLDAKLDEDISIGPLQFGYTDGTMHPSHYGMSMYYSKHTSNYFVDINNPIINTDLRNRSSAVAIYGGLDVYGDINIIGSKNYKIDGIIVASSNVFNNLLGNFTSASSTIEENQVSTQSLNDVLVSGKLVTVLPQKSMTVAHINDLSTLRYLSTVGTSVSANDTPFTVYNNNNGSIGKFFSVYNDAVKNPASIELGMFNPLGNGYTGSQGNSVRLKVSNYSPTESLITTTRNLFELSYLNVDGKNYNNCLSIYNNASTSYVYFGNKSCHNVDTGLLHTGDISNVGFHIENTSKYGLVLSNPSRSPVISLHRSDTNTNKFWIVEGPSLDSNKLIIKKSETSAFSYTPGDTENVVVLTDDRRVGINVENPSTSFDIVGAYDAPGVQIANKYSEFSLAKKYTTVEIINSNMIYENLKVYKYGYSNNDLIYSYNNASNTYYSGIRYWIENKYLPEKDIYNKDIPHNYISTSNFLVTSNVVVQNTYDYVSCNLFKFSSNNLFLDKTEFLTPKYTTYTNYALTCNVYSLGNVPTANIVLGFSNLFTCLPPLPANPPITPRNKIIFDYDYDNIVDSNLLFSRQIETSQSGNNPFKLNISVDYLLNFLTNIYNFNNIIYNFSQNSEREQKEGVIRVANTPNGNSHNIFFTFSALYTIFNTTDPNNIWSDKQKIFDIKYTTFTFNLFDRVFNITIGLPFSVLFDYPGNDRSDYNYLLDLKAIIFSSLNYYSEINTLTNILGNTQNTYNYENNGYQFITNTSNNNFINIYPLTTFLTGSPIREYYGYSYEYNIINTTLKEYSLYYDVNVFNYVFTYKITFYDKYSVYDFTINDNFHPIYMSIYTVEILPHILLQNKIDFDDNNETIFGKTNKIYSKNGNLEFVSQENDNNEKLLLKITNTGDLTFEGGLNFNGDIDLNSHDLKINNLIVQGNIYDRLGASLIPGYHTSNYEKAVKLQSSNITLITSNFTVIGSSNIEFRLIGKNTNGVIIYKDTHLNDDLTSYDYNLLKIYEGENVAFTITNGGKVGIQVENPQHDLHVQNDIGAFQVIADYIEGDGSRMRNVNFLDRNTSMLKEGSNLYHTSARVAEIVIASNLHTSNFVISTSNELANYIVTTSNILIDRMNLFDLNQSNFVISTSNFLASNIMMASNAIINRMNLFDLNQSNFVISTSNFLASNIMMASNAIIHRMNLFDFNQSNFVNSTSNFLASNIAMASNAIIHRMNLFDLNQSNFVIRTSNLLASNIMLSSNAIINKMNLMDRYQSNFVISTSNYLASNIILTSNAIIQRMDIFDVNQSNFVTDTSNLLINYVNINSLNLSNLIETTSNFITYNLINTSNYIFEYINDYTSNADARLRNLRQDSINAINESKNSVTSFVTNINLDNIAQGIGHFDDANRYLKKVNGNYKVTNILDDDIIELKNVRITNLIAGSFQATTNYTSIAQNTASQTASTLQIKSANTNDTLLYILNEGNINEKDIIGVSNVVNDSKVFYINNNGIIGIGTNPNIDIIATTDYRLYVKDILQADYFKGDGCKIQNVNFLDRSTSMLQEGSNLYFTFARVGEIAAASNIQSSNYVINISNILVTNFNSNINKVSNDSSNFVYNVSNFLDSKMISLNTDSSNFVYSLSNLMNNKLTEYRNDTSNFVYNMSNILGIKITRLNNDSSNFVYNMSNFLISRINSFNSVNDDTSNLVANMSNVLAVNMSILHQDSSNFVYNISNLYGNQIVKFITDASNLVTNISNILDSKIVKLNNDGSNLVYNISNLFNTRLTTFNNDGSNLVNNVSNILSSRITTLNIDSSNFVYNISNILNNRLTTINNDGSNMVYNISNLLNNRITVINNDSSNFVNNISNIIARDIRLTSNNIIDYVNSKTVEPFKTLKDANNKTYYEYNITGNNRDYLRFAGNVKIDGDFEVSKNSIRELVIEESKYTTDTLNVKSISAGNITPVLKVEQLGSGSIANLVEVNDNQTNLFIIDYKGRIGINTNVISDYQFGNNDCKIDIYGDLRFSGNINEISSNEVRSLKNIRSNIQQQLDSNQLYSSNYTSNLVYASETRLTSFITTTASTYFAATNNGWKNNNDVIWTTSNIGIGTSSMSDLTNKFELYNGNMNITLGKIINYTPATTSPSIRKKIVGTPLPNALSRTDQIYDRYYSNRSLTLHKYYIQFKNEPNLEYYQLSFTSYLKCRMFMIGGGGGGGGGAYGGGGGAGAYFEGEVLFEPGIYNFYVGKGGNGTKLENNVVTAGENGGNTYVTRIVNNVEQNYYIIDNNQTKQLLCKGGGKGGYTILITSGWSNINTPHFDGGCGGGAAGYDNNLEINRYEGGKTINSGTVGIGKEGGRSYAENQVNNFASGGGGGIITEGGDATKTDNGSYGVKIDAGNGGNAKQFLFKNNQFSVVFGGGGGGAEIFNKGTIIDNQQSAGLGGSYQSVKVGGDGTFYHNDAIANGLHAVADTGSGGGGSGYGTGGNGSAGVIIIEYTEFLEIKEQYAYERWKSVEDYTYTDNKSISYIEGNVGIGTNSPDNYKLKVSDTSLFNTIYSCNIYISSNVGIGTIPNNDFKLNVNGKANINDSLNVGSVNTSNIVTISLFSSNLNVYGNAQCYSNLFIASNLGIGTFAPRQNLHIQQDGIDNYIRIDNGGLFKKSGIMFTEKNNYGYFMNYENATSNFVIGLQQQNTNNSTAFISLTSNLNIGIGTTNPRHLLHLQKSGNHNFIRVDNGGDTFNAGIQFCDTNAYGHSIQYNKTNSNLEFGIQNSSGITNTLMILTSNANLGIGTTSIIGDAKLHIAGKVLIDANDGVPSVGVLGGASGTKMVIKKAVDNGSYPYAFGTEANALWYNIPANNSHKFYINNILCMHINEYAVGIATTNINNDVRLHVGGKLLIDGGNGSPSNGEVGGSDATRLILKKGDASISPYALGTEANALWYNVANGASHKFYIANNLQMIISGGNVGIGNNTTPAAALHIKKSGSDNYIRVENGGTGYNAGIVLCDDNAYGHRIQYNKSNSNLDFLLQNNTGIVTNIMSLTSNGAIGMGTTNIQSGARLHIDGRLLVDGSDNIPSVGIVGTNGTRLILKKATDTTYPFALGTEANALWYNVGDGASHKFYIANNLQMIISGGNVGIGNNTTPVAALHIKKSGSDNYIRVENGGPGYSAGVILCDDNGYGHRIQYNKSNSNLDFVLQNNAGVITTIMSLTSNGAIGMGTTNIQPGSRLHIDGRLLVDGGDNVPSVGIVGTNGTRLILKKATDTTYPYAMGVEPNALWYNIEDGASHKFYIANNLQMIVSGGNVGIGNNTTLEAALHIKKSGSDNYIRVDSGGSIRKAGLKLNNTNNDNGFTIEYEENTSNVFLKSKMGTATTNTLSLYYNNTVAIGHYQLAQDHLEKNASLAVRGKVVIDSVSSKLSPSNGSLYGNSGTLLVLGVADNYPNTPYALGLENEALWYGVPNNKSHKFYNADKLSMIIKNNNVGIGGITEPVDALHIKKTGSDNFIRIENGGSGRNAGIILCDDNAYGHRIEYNKLTSNLQFCIQNNTGLIEKTVMLLSSNGNVAIGTTVNNNYVLNVGGKINATELHVGGTSLPDSYANKIHLHNYTDIPNLSNLFNQQYNQDIAYSNLPYGFSYVSDYIKTDKPGNKNDGYYVMTQGATPTFDTNNVNSIFLQLAIARYSDSTKPNPYIYLRYKEELSVKPWQKIYAGYADECESSSNLKYTRKINLVDFDGTKDISYTSWWSNVGSVNPYFGTNLSSSNIYYDKGSVGIGTTAPITINSDNTKFLHVYGKVLLDNNKETEPNTLEYGSEGTRLIFKKGNNIGEGKAAYSIGIGTSNMWYCVPTTNENNQNCEHSFYIGLTKRMVLTSSGRLGIGTTNPLQPLHIYSVDPNNIIRLDIGNSGTGTAELQLAKDNTNMMALNCNPSLDLSFRVYDNSSTSSALITISKAGNVGIGTSPGATYKLDVNGETIIRGSLRATGDLISSFSDIRLKEKTGTIENAVDKMMKIDTFKYKPNSLAIGLNNFEKEKINLGVSAQDVRNVFPELVTLAPFDTSNLENGDIVSKSGSNYLTVSYERMVPWLIECIKELKKENDFIKKQLNLV